MSPTQLIELSRTHEVGLSRACRCDADLRAERGGLECDTCRRAVQVTARPYSEDMPTMPARTT